MIKGDMITPPVHGSMSQCSIIRCFACQCIMPNSFLLHCFNTNNVFHLNVYNPWPLYEPRRLEGFISRLFVPKLSLRKRKNLKMIRFIIQFCKYVFILGHRRRHRWHIFWSTSAYWKFLIQLWVYSLEKYWDIFVHR